ncbi:hypothetical protein QYF61_017584 [Mycteria americana]|uniref:Uncharacterized protein n=1 Tax=Mycteria americana TaxID=33587 RepID=A0AAN7MSH3_MYCAM|nr:hypothetical protein QYF61_017584 [Mycteria americana]
MLCQVHKKLGGGTAKTADPNWPKGYSIPYDVMLNSLPHPTEEMRLCGTWLPTGAKPQQSFLVGHEGDTQITAMCWGLAHAYQALFNTIQYPQWEEKVSGSDDKTTGTAATPTPATGTVVTPTPATGTAAGPGNQPVPVSVAPIHKKKPLKQKSARLERDDEKAGPS